MNPLKEKKAIFKEILPGHYTVYMEQHIKVFFFGLALKKKRMVRSRSRHFNMFSAFS
jgi:hypothetical protein